MKRALAVGMALLLGMIGGVSLVVACSAGPSAAHAQSASVSRVVTAEADANQLVTLSYRNALRSFACGASLSLTCYAMLTGPFVLTDAALETAGNGTSAYQLRFFVAPDDTAAQTCSTSGNSCTWSIVESGTINAALALKGMRYLVKPGETLYFVKGVVSSATISGFIPYQ
jgi:hypothetical protein